MKAKVITLWQVADKDIFLSAVDYGHNSTELFLFLQNTKFFIPTAYLSHMSSKPA